METKGEKKHYLCYVFPVPINPSTTFKGNYEEIMIIMLLLRISIWTNKAILFYCHKSWMAVSLLSYFGYFRFKSLGQ